MDVNSIEPCATEPAIHWRERNAFRFILNSFPNLRILPRPRSQIECRRKR
jgi:hypothetical protein